MANPVRELQMEKRPDNEHRFASAHNFPKFVKVGR
jgi:hypothetical protein